MNNPYPRLPSPILKYRERELQPDGFVICAEAHFSKHDEHHLYQELILFKTVRKEKLFSNNDQELHFHILYVYLEQMGVLHRCYFPMVQLVHRGVQSKAEAL